MNLKKLIGNKVSDSQRVEDGNPLGSLLKPLLKAGVKKASKSLAKGAAKNAGKAAGKKAAGQAAKGTAKGAAKGFLSKYLSKVSDLLENVDPEDVVKATELAKNVNKIVKILSKDDLKDEEIDDVADLILNTEVLLMIVRH